MLLTNVFCCGFTFRPAGPGLMLLMDYLGIHFDFVHLAVEMCRRKSATDRSSSLTEHSTQCVCVYLVVIFPNYIFFVPKQLIYHMKLSFFLKM